MKRKTLMMLVGSMILVLMMGTAVQAQTVNIVLPGPEPADDWDQVQDIANERLENDGYDFQIDVKFIPYSDYKDKTLVQLATGEPIDLIHDAPWHGRDQKINAGYYYPLEDLLEEHGERVYDYREPEDFESGKFKVDGERKLIGIPNKKSYGDVVNTLVRKDIREELGFEPITTLEELEDFAYAVRDEKPELVPMIAPNVDRFGLHVGQMKLTEDERTPKFIFDHASGLFWIAGDPNDPVEALDERGIATEPGEPLLSWLKRMRRWYQDGLIHSDILAIDDLNSYQNSGNVAISFQSNSTVPMSYQEALKSTDPNAEWELVSLHSYLRGQHGTDNQIYMPISGENKVEAMQFLNWANKQENYDLLVYGIEGEHWEKTDPGFYKPLKNFDYRAWAWLENYETARIDSTLPEFQQEYLLSTQEIENVKIDPYGTFNMDKEPIKNEETRFAALRDKYWPAIITGVVDPEEHLEKFASEGGDIIDTIIKERRRQKAEFAIEQGYIDRDYAIEQGYIEE